ncbi:MAG: hypothetical protein M1836_001496 [Candelina mexicana]|nr:MAG: hypothetical protein M1836_001496 [Candelina mexicana]
MATSEPPYRNQEQLGGSINYNEGVLIQGNNITTSRDVNINVTAGLARSLYRSSINAGQSFQQLLNDISSMVRALDVAKGGVWANNANEDRGREFLAILTGCDAVLKSIEVPLLEYTGLLPTERKTWEQSASNSERLAHLEKELGRNVGRLTLFNTTQNNLTSNTINDTLQLFIKQIRAQSQDHALLPIQTGQDVNEHCHSGNSETDDPNSDRQAPCDNDGSPGSRESSIYSSYTAESLTVDQKENWRQLRKALEGVGITPEMFDQRQGFITSRIRELIAGYAFEEEGRLDNDDMSRHQLKEKLLPEHTMSGRDSEVFTSRSSIRTFYTCMSGSEALASPLPPQRAAKFMSGQPTRADQILKALGYYRQDKALFAAIEAEDIPRVEIALSKGANVNGDPKKTNSVQKIPIGLAIRLGNERIVRLLLEYNADIEFKTTKLRSALWVAAWMGHKDIVQILLDYRADLESMHENGTTPLMIAADNGHTDVVQLLLDHEADVNIKGPGDWTPLHSAAQNDHIDIVRLLLKHGADVNIQDHNGWAPLCSAAERPGHVDIVRLLLKHGADVNIQAHDGWAPLHSAAAQNDHIDIVRLLLKHGADVNIQDRNGWAPLYSTAGQPGHIEIVRLLLEHGADVDIKDHYGSAPLHSAALNGCIESIRLLLKHGADVDIRDHHGCAPLHGAALNPCMESIRLLLQHGADVNRQDTNSWAPLHGAARDGYIDTTQLLLEHGADVDIKNKLGETPLMITAGSSKPITAVVSLLLAHGANIESTNEDGRSALDYARIYCAKEVELLLLSHLLEQA